MNNHLSESTLAEAEVAFAQLNKLGLMGSNHNIIEFITVWKRLAERVQDPYFFTIFDYENDLDGRMLIERALVLMSSEANQEVKIILAPYDEQFKQGTVPMNNPISLSAEKNDWWYWRKPRHCRYEDDQADFDALT